MKEESENLRNEIGLLFLYMYADMNHYDLIKSYTVLCMAIGFLSIFVKWCKESE